MSNATDIRLGAASERQRQRRRKKVPTLYEIDESKYAGPHHWQTQWWARAVRKLWRYRAYTRWVEQACSHIDIKGLENLQEIDGPCVFIANHQSHLDTLVTHTALPEAIKSKIYYGAAQDRWFVKGRRKLVRKPWYQSLALGTFPIMRGGGLGALSYAHRLLQKRQHVFLFPEGTRAISEDLGEFKHGATILALEHDLPVVPIYLSGLRALRPKGSKQGTCGVAGVEFLQPVRFAPGTPVSDATALLHQRMSRVHRGYVEPEGWATAA
jgi:1-acyl-sn-glycerol-3-phosphate acyltransferase